MSEATTKTAWATANPDDIQTLLEHYIGSMVERNEHLLAVVTAALKEVQDTDESTCRNLLEVAVDMLFEIPHLQPMTELTKRAGELLKEAAHAQAA